ncbi:two-component system activity regulator YycH [Sporolactobacillus sp. STCC-11]|uniref:YycH family regulatory protein n=1 Tax=Sporolactobacillus caesalpiniae TaxID=3230362 RepID=UPI0033936A98
MHREVFKSLLLGALVFASVAMTFNILFYKSDFKNYNPNSTKKVAIAQARKTPEVIRPNLMLEHNKNGDFGQISRTQIQKAYTLLRGSVFSVQTNYSSGMDSGDNALYKLVFPGPLTFGALSKVFQFDTGGKSLSENHILIDRVEVFRSTNGSITAVFYSPNEKSKLFTTVDHLNINNLKNVYANVNLKPYARQTLKGKVVYLPQEKTKMHSEVSYYEQLSLEEFIPILFTTDPDNVFPTKGKTQYTDSERQMERTNNIVQFVNPGITSTVEERQDPIIGSFDWMNTYKLWTDDYIYQGTSLKNYRGDGAVTFRMTLGNYMVFNTEVYPNWYLSMIELTWKSGELSNYKGTLLDLNPVDSQGSMVLDSGKEILDRLSDAHVDVNAIEDLSIGYELKNPSSNSDQSIVATPDWFYKMNGRWKSVSDKLFPSQINNGKEDPS